VNVMPGRAPVAMRVRPTRRHGAATVRGSILRPDEGGRAGLGGPAERW